MAEVGQTAEQRKQRDNQRSKDRYRTDPEYRRRKILAACKAQHKRYQADPAYRRQQLARTAAWKKERYASDPEYRKQAIAYAARWNKEHRAYIDAKRTERYKADPAYRSQILDAHRKWVTMNRETHAQKTKVWRDNNPGLLKENHWKKMGIDMAAWSYTKYLATLKAQKYKCLGCGKKLVALSRDIVTDSEVACADHIHDGSGRVRWLLCKGCNTALGGARDNPATLVRLADMLMHDIKNFNKAVN
jgi:hypothetical protein